MKIHSRYLLRKGDDVPPDGYKRAGTVPFFIDRNTGKIYFFLMIDRVYRQLTDCGGRPARNEDWIDTAIRETREESRGFFSFTRDQIHESLVCINNKTLNLIVFVDISSHLNTVGEAYKLCNLYRKDFIRGSSKHDKSKYLENSMMKFYHFQGLYDVLESGETVYRPVRLMLKRFIYSDGPSVLMNTR